jgi:hypothetical protein
MTRPWFVGLALIFAVTMVPETLAERGGGTRFAAHGATTPERQDPGEYRLWKKPSVVVSFDLLPTAMEFYLPSFACQVTENGVKHSNWWAETYDLRVSGGSFETLMDRKNEYARMWIESQNEARIVVRVRGALCDREGRIAHTDIPSGSPHGKGDWVDEWYYVYPDGVNVRHVKIYTGLASRSRPFGIDRDPPKVVHEFGETAIMNKGGHPTDHIDTDAVTLIRMVADHPNRRVRAREWSVAQAGHGVPYRLRDKRCWHQPGPVGQDEIARECGVRHCTGGRVVMFGTITNWHRPTRRSPRNQ